MTRSQRSKNVAAVAWTWWPDGQYRPIEPDEGGTLYDMLGVTEPSPYRDRLFARAARPFQQGHRQAGGWASTTPARHAPQPQLMLVLVPRTEQRVAAPPATGMGASGGPPQPATLPCPEADAPVGLPPGTDSEPQRGWLIPFDPPPEPREGDNQALAVNTADGSVVYDVAFALVWVTEGSPVEGRNEAYALANCHDCRAVAVAFQVVLVVGHVDLAAPVNAAVAANYDCVDCVSHALAVQLVATLTDLPDDEVMSELAQVWAQLEELRDNVELLPLEEVYAELLAVKGAILEILSRDRDGLATDSELAEDTASGGSSPEVTATPEPTPTGEPTPEPTEEPTAEPTPEPTEEP